MSSSASPATELLANGGFDEDLVGWTVSGPGAPSVTESGGPDGGAAVLVPGVPGDGEDTEIQQSVTPGLASGTQVRGVVSVRAGSVDQPLRLVVDERSPQGVLSHVEQKFSAPDTEWHTVSTTALTVERASSLVLRVVVPGSAPDGQLWVDDLSLQPVASPRLDLPASARRLSNGCAISPRGVPLCSAYVGGAYGRNDDPDPWEGTLGARLGIRRTYYTADQVDYAMRTAGEDLAVGRLPWISFKAPLSWHAMARGDGDRWASDLAARLAELPGPVWVAFHHEPEGDGDLAAWTAMQERLAPIVRQAASNAAFTVILTGYNQLFGPQEFHLDTIWPSRAAVDVAGFDVYNFHGATRNGHAGNRPVPVEEGYLRPLSEWAARQGVAWALAETGLTATGAQHDPRWVQRTHQALLESGGVALTYFNSTANSIADWSLNTPGKQQQFREAILTAPSL